MIGQKVKSPSGFDVVMGANHHMAKPVMIGEIQADGQFSIVYQSKALPPKAWSPYVEANKGKCRRLVVALGVRRLLDPAVRCELIPDAEPLVAGSGGKAICRRGFALLFLKS